jgi:hypothetical protein
MHFYIPPKIAYTIENERQAFFQVHRRYPTVLDPIFCDPSYEASPRPMPPDQLARYLNELSRRTGERPEHIYGYHCAFRAHPSRQMARFVSAAQEYALLTAPPRIQ